MPEESPRAAQSMVGQFLVSMPRLHGTVFEDAVIYLWLHDERGAQGLVVNHACELSLAQLLDQLDIPSRGGFDTPVAAGGPVEPQRGFILHSDDVRIESSEAAGDRLVLTHSREILDLIAAHRGPSRFLVALGFAGWGPGQLEYELDEATWLTAPGSHDTLFETPFDKRLDEVLGVLGIDRRLLGADAGIA